MNPLLQASIRSMGNLERWAAASGAPSNHTSRQFAGRLGRAESGHWLLCNSLFTNRFLSSTEEIKKSEVIYQFCQWYTTCVESNYEVVMV